MVSSQGVKVRGGPGGAQSSEKLKLDSVALSQGSVVSGAHRAVSAGAAVEGAHRDQESGAIIPQLWHQVQEPGAREGA